MKSIEIELLLKAHQARIDADKSTRGTTAVFHYHFDEPCISVYKPGGEYKETVLFFTDGKTFTPCKTAELKHPDFEELRDLIETRFFLEYKPLVKD